MKYIVKRKKLSGGKWKVEVLKVVASAEYDKREDADAAGQALINQFADDLADDSDDTEA